MLFLIMALEFNIARSRPKEGTIDFDGGNRPFALTVIANKGAGRYICLYNLQLN
jgi:hypothetical protein